MKMRWWRLLVVPLAVVLVVVGGCAVGEGGGASTESTAPVEPPATTVATARVGGPLVGVISSDDLATELAGWTQGRCGPCPEADSG